MSGPTDLWSVAVMLVLAAWLGWSSRVLARAAWPLRAPGLGILAWQTLTMGIALSVLMAGFALVVPTLPAVASLAELARLCTIALGARLESWQTVLVSTAGLVLAATLIIRFASTLLLSQARARRQRQQHRDSIAVLSVGQVGGAAVIDAKELAVYCIPGRGGQIVATRGAVELLDSAQLQSVLAHERCHLRARHHVAISVACALSATFWRVRAFETAATQIAQLAEMQADDAAGPGARRHLAAALLDLASGPETALNAGGATLTRATRLLEPRAPLPRTRRWGIATAAIAVVLSPVAVGMLPAPGSAVAGFCCGDVDAQRAHATQTIRGGH